METYQDMETRTCQTLEVPDSKFFSTVIWSLQVLPDMAEVTILPFLCVCNLLYADFLSEGLLSSDTQKPSENFKL